ncbi:MAG: bis-aminopropyl spermidine synthase family protein [Deltaproteobacteria bacterium]|nr:bis-aminopropyl spermidine synthase family protein [Deltaproteobacteria bacterium]
MDSGEFRVLDAVAESTLARTEVVRRSGEPHSVLKALGKAHPDWFAQSSDRFQLSPAGLEALAAARRSRALGSKRTNDELAETVRLLGAGRSIRRDLDQVYATPESVVRRARFLIAEGCAERSLLFLGDDDLTSAATRSLAPAAELSVLEVDPELVALLKGAEVDVHEHDLREPIPKTLRERDAVFTDPPYAIEGFALFIARAIEALREGGTLYLAFGASRRAPDRALAKQRLLAECGLVIREVRRDFSEYDGAESIGSRSDLWVLRTTPQTKAPTLGPGGELYTRRKPKRR